MQNINPMLKTRQEGNPEHKQNTRLNAIEQPKITRPFVHLNAWQVKGKIFQSLIDAVNTLLGYGYRETKSTTIN